MDILASGPLTERHLTYFGAITHGFARHELLMQRIMAHAMGADDSSTIQLTKTMSFSQKRDALLALLRHRDVPLDQIDAIRDHLKLPSRLRALRDDICHSDWTAGVAMDSIQPAWIFNQPPTIKPIHATAGAGTFFEDDDDRSEYSLGELARNRREPRGEPRAFSRLR